MLKLLLYAAGGIVGLHGLVHLIGFAAYWPITAVTELPYKTILAGGRWDVGLLGMRVYSVFWLIAALVMLIAAAGLITQQNWWRPLLLGAVVLSSFIIALDWDLAFRGLIVNAMILVLMGLDYLFSR